MRGKLAFLNEVREEVMARVANSKQAEIEKEKVLKEFQLGVIANPRMWSYCADQKQFIFYIDELSHIELDVFVALGKELAGDETAKYEATYAEEYKCNGFCECDAYEVFLVKIDDEVE